MVSSVVATGPVDEGRGDVHGRSAPNVPRRPAAAGANPPFAGGQPVEGEVDHRRGEQRQHLADDQAADHR
jgi:hypothetical protein